MTSLLVFDDDPLFGSIIKRYGKARNIDITVCEKMEDFALKALERNFDVAIVDYMLDDFRGPDVARVLEGQPTLLISRFKDLSAPTKKWPNCIKGFISKDLGAEAIVEKALTFASSK